MITIANLQTSLLDLLHEIEGSEVNVIIGGAFPCGDLCEKNPPKSAKTRTSVENLTKPNRTISTS